MPHRLLVFVVLWLAGPAFAADPPSLWIADFQNLTGDASYDPAGKGVAAILTGRFVRADAVTVVERSRIDAVLSELDLARSGVVDPSTAVRAGRIIGARYVVLGAFATVRLPQLVMTVRVVDTDSGEVVFARDLSDDVGPEGEQFFVMADRIVASIVEGLGVELTERDRRELADVPKVDLRELRGLQAYGGKAPEVAADHPDSLFRDKSRDMLTDGTEGSWTIYDYRGTQYGARSFASRIGDQRTLDQIEAELEGARRRRKRSATVGLLLGALGFGSYGLLALNDWSQRERLSILVGGGTVGTLGLTGALIANTAYAGRVISVDQPGRWYSADEADERIDDYNAALGEPRP